MSYRVVLWLWHEYLESLLKNTRKQDAWLRVRGSCAPTNICGNIVRNLIGTHSKRCPSSHIALLLSVLFPPPQGLALLRDFSRFLFFRAICRLVPSAHASTSRIYCLVEYTYPLNNSRHDIPIISIHRREPRS